MLAAAIRKEIFIDDAFVVASSKPARVVISALMILCAKDMHYIRNSRARSLLLQGVSKDAEDHISRQTYNNLIRIVNALSEVGMEAVL